MQIDYLLSIISIFISIIFYFATQKIFLSYGITDEINNRSSHSVTSTRSGGFSIFIVIFIISFIYYILGIELYDYSILIPLSLLFVTGLYDDVYKLDFKLKIIFQIIAAKIIIDNGLIIDNLHGLFGVFELNRIIAQMFTIFFIVAIINSINFIDGIDGLAISIVILFLSLFELFSISQSDFFYLSIITISSLVPLYYFNFSKKKKVFLGDSGSLFLGGAISIFTIYILSNNYIIKPQFDLHKLIFVFSILSYPIIDIIRICFLRLINGKSPFIADKNHIHHLILSRTKNHSKATLIIVLFCILFLIIVQFLNRIL